MGIKYIASVFLVLSLFIVPSLTEAQTQSGEAPANKPNVRSVEPKTNAATRPAGTAEKTRAQIQSKAADVTAAKETRDEKRAEETTRQGTLSNTRDAARAEAVTQKEDREAENIKKREEALERQEAARQQVIEKRKERIEAYFEKMFVRLDAAILRLEKLAERIDSRIEKFDERAVDVEKAKQLLADAQTRIESARTALADARESVVDIISGENPKEVFDRTRETIQSVVSHIKDAHQALVQSIIALKGGADTETDSKKEQEETQE